MKQTLDTLSRITQAEIARAAEYLRQYKSAKQRLDSRLYSEKRWWRERFFCDGRNAQKNHTSAWLLNSISHKHADICESYPVCRVLPREPGDEQDAAMLSDVIPVIMKNCEFEKTFGDNAWSKLKHGMAAYGIFWNPSLCEGLGDIDIRRIDVMNLFWSPDVSDLQESPNVFLVTLEDTNSLMARYHLSPDALRLIGDESLLSDTGGSYVGGITSFNEAPQQTAVVDWYYKTLSSEGKEVVHFAKFTGSTLLYASQNDPLYAERGWYDHGKYPFVLDVLFPEEGTPEGYGILALGRQQQGYIDELDGHLLEYANWASRVRYWVKRSLGVNEKDFLDPDRHIIEVEGDIDEEKLRQITLSPMDSALSELRRMKIDELKETTGVQDVSIGTASGGVVSATAILALQEAGGKTSRDCIIGTHRAFVAIVHQVIELIRQFYDGMRTFRITGKEGDFHYVSYSNKGISERIVGVGADGEQRYYRPIFDIDVSAERQTPQNRLERNDFMLRLYQAGMFDEGQEASALRALSGMDFDGIGALYAALSEAVATRAKEGDSL